MKETLERVHFDGEENLALKLHRRHYPAAGKVQTALYGLGTDWQGIRRKFPLGKNLKKAIAKLYDLDKKNAQEVDFDAEKEKRAARGMTFSKWAAECKGAMSPWHLKPLEDFFGGKPLTAIDDVSVQKYREKRSGEKVIRHGEVSSVTVSPTTINKEVSALRKVLRMARKKGIQDRVTAFPMAKEPSRNYTLTADEYKKLLDKCDPWLRRACIVAYETSLCRSDLLNLTWPQIDFEQGIIAGSRAKTGAAQKTPIVTPELWAVLDELKAERQKVANAAGLVFTIGGQPIPENLFEYYFRRARKAAGLPNFRFHDLRHCAITRWAAAGVPTAAAMLAAGHSSLASHKKYQNLQNDELKAGFQKLFTSCSRGKSEEKESAASA